MCIHLLNLNVETETKYNKEYLSTEKHSTLIFLQKFHYAIICNSAYIRPVKKCEFEIKIYTVHPIFNTIKYTHNMYD